MSKNNNVNQNAIQIIFPSDMELRKVKKKKRKSPSSSKKKELIAELKELLQTYDNEIAVAKEKKVTLPADLGELPKNINEVKKPGQSRRTATGGKSTPKNQTGRYTVGTKKNKSRDNM